LARDDIDGEDVRGAVSALFYAAEAAIAGIAEVNAIDTKRNHRLKADAATELFKQGLLEEDFGPLLRNLNQARKDVWYDGEEPDFGEETVSDVADRVATLVEAAEGAAGA
jgi:hypothetical protein